MNAEHAKALLALIDAEPETFMQICTDLEGVEDPAAFSQEIVTELGELASEEVEVTDEEGDDEEV